jgi:hypothetical protein
LKGFDQVHFICRGLLYGDRDQTLFIDDEPNKALQNPKWSILFFEPFKGCELSKNQGAMFRPCISIVANIKRFAFCKYGLYPFHNHRAVLRPSFSS